MLSSVRAAIIIDISNCIMTQPQDDVISEQLYFVVSAPYNLCLTPYHQFVLQSHLDQKLTSSHGGIIQYKAWSHTERQLVVSFWKGSDSHCWMNTVFLGNAQESKVYKMHI